MFLCRSGLHQHGIGGADRLGIGCIGRIRRSGSSSYLAQCSKFSDTDIAIFFLTLIANGKNFSRRQLQLLLSRRRFALLFCCSIVQRGPIGCRIGNKPSQFVQKVAFLRLCHILPITSSWRVDNNVPHDQSLIFNPHTVSASFRGAAALPATALPWGAPANGARRWAHPFHRNNHIHRHQSDEWSVRFS